MLGRLLFILTIFLCLVSCRAQKEITDSVKNDSVRVEYRYYTDTLVIHDTVYIKGTTITDKESNTQIHFGEQGGSYNTKTGEANGVTGVTMSNKEKEQAETIISLTNENKRITAVNDSLMTKISKEDTKTEVIPEKMNRWEHFMYISGYVLWGIILLLLIYFILKILRKFHVI